MDLFNLVRVEVEHGPSAHACADCICGTVLAQTSLVILSIALAETVSVHYLIRRNKVVVALFIDRVFRVCLPLGVYVCLVTGMLVAGVRHDKNTGLIIAGLGSFACLSGGALYVKYDHSRAMRHRKATVVKLKALLHDVRGEVQHTKALQKVCRLVFRSFDYVLPI